MQYKISMVMGLTNSPFLDDLIETDKAVLRRTNHMSISLTKVTKPFNIANNVSSGYKTSCTDRWMPH